VVFIFVTTSLSERNFFFKLPVKIKYNEVRPCEEGGQNTPSFCAQLLLGTGYYNSRKKYPKSECTLFLEDNVNVSFKLTEISRRSPVDPDRS